MIVFRKLDIEGWRQFEDVSIELHPRLTVITGANGSGKSTLLSIMTRHFGWNKNYLSTPVKDSSGSTSYISGVFTNLWHKVRFLRSNPGINTIGQILYSNNINADIFVGVNNAVQYDIQIQNQQPVQGLHVDSYRPAPIYMQVSTIPLQPMTASQAFNNYNSEVVSRYQGGYTQFSPIFRMKEAIISMAVFGQGNVDIGRNQSIIDTFSGFNEILRKILPESLGFEKISVRTPDVVLVTRSGEFMLDASSGGIMTLIDIAWRIFMFSRDKASFVVTMDEPENHLHPSMQRSLMRRLLEAFPNVQFIIATHSPFMVSSVKDSNVYVLKYSRPQSEPSNQYQDSQVAVGARDRVTSIRLSNINKAANANEILREVLGVPATMPEWVEDGIDRLMSDFKGKEITRDLLATLRSRLSEYGYEEYYPEALAALTRK